MKLGVGSRLNDQSFGKRLSRSGRYLVFDAEATDLTLDATHDGGEEDVFLFDFLGPDAVGIPFCFGVGCPCGNDDPNAGCANSTGSGALLEGSGSASRRRPTPSAGPAGRRTDRAWTLVPHR